jgi:hypothetical protein
VAWIGDRAGVSISDSLGGALDRVLPELIAIDLVVG